MFDSVRTHRRWLMFFLLLLVFPSFVITGIYGYNRFVGDEGAVASVNGEPILPQQLESAQRAQMERLRRMFGQNFDPKIFDTPASRAATLDALIADKTLEHEARQEHIFVTEARLRELIASEAAFQQEGKFNYERYKTLLTAQGLSEQAFERRVREDMRRQILQQAIAASAIVPRTVSEQMRRLADEQRQIRELRFPVEEFRSKAKIDDAAIKSYYDSNQTQFRTPESVDAEYVVLTLDDVAAQIKVAESDLRQEYEQNRSRWGQDEQRRASHILFTTGEGGSAKDKAAARQLAEQTLEQLRKKPSEFEQLARQLSKDPGSAANGGDLGFFGRNMMVKPFEEAAYALKKGELSGVVESDFGFHIIKLVDIKPAQIKPFDDVKAEIEADLRRQQAQKRFAEASEVFTNTVYEQADTLAPVAEKLKLQVQRIGNLTRSGLPTQAGAGNSPAFNQRVTEALFTEESLKSKRNTQAIETAPSTLVAARVTEYRASTVKPLTQVQNEIRSTLEQREAGRLAKAAGEARLQELLKSPSDAGFSAARTVSRSKPEGLAVSAIQSIMSVAADKLPSYTGAEVSGGGYTVYQVLSSTVPPATADSKEAQDQARGLAQQYGAADDAAYIAALKIEHKAKRLKTELAQSSSESNRSNE